MITRFSENVFDYRALRLLVGLIAFALPFVVSLVAEEPLSSISASYHSAARDLFVGMLFVVSAFLWAYNGHTEQEAWASKAASLSAALIALFPVSCDSCAFTYKSGVHCLAAVALFSILAYFCLGPFRRNIRGKGGKKNRRSAVYLICGWIMLGCMASLGILMLTMSREALDRMSITYWAEAIALGAFGVAWMVAGKYFRYFVDDADALYLFR